MSARCYEFGDPSEILERRQRNKARDIAELIFKLPEAMWEQKLSLMKPGWRSDVETYLKALKRQRAIDGRA